jgi:hypothetical protein
MKTVKIKTTGNHRFGQKFIYSVCDVTFDDNGVAEVTEEQAKLLIEKDDRLSIVGIVEDNKEDSEETNYEVELKQMTKSELVELAGNIKGINTLIMGKDKLIKLILENIKK